MIHNEKVHYKMYKAGTRWLVAAIAGVSVAVGLGVANPATVSADTTTPEATTDPQSDPEPATQTLHTATQTPATTATADTSATAGADDAAASTATKAAAAAATPTAATTGATPTAAQAPAAPTTQAAVAPVSARIAVPEPAAPVVNGMGDVSTSIGSGQNKATVASYGTSNAAPDVTKDSTDIDARNADALSASFTIGNGTGSTLHIHPDILLPLFNDTHTGWVLDPSKVTEATFTDPLPSTVTLTYSMVGFYGQYLSYTALMQQHPDFTWDKLQAILIDGPIAAGTKYTVNLPMIWRSTGSTVGTMGALNYNSANYGSSEDIYATATLVPLTYGTATTTRTINFVDSSGTPMAAPVVQTITYKTVKNGSTYQTVYTPQGVYEQYQVPPISGYTADVTKVARVAVDPTTTAPTNAEDVTVTYTPKLSYGTASSTRTINFVDENGKQIAAPKVQTISYKTVTNEATGETDYTPQDVYEKYQVPPISGYTADVTTVARLAVAPGTTAPTNAKDVTVTYTPNLKYGTATTTRTINFVDENGKQIAGPKVQTITYKTVTNEVTGETVYTPQDVYEQYTAPTISGYAANAASVARLAVAPGTTAPTNAKDVTITYTPKLTYGTATSTRTINLVDETGKQLAAPVVQTLTYKTVTNAVTGETVYTPQGGYGAYQVPTFKGYTPEVSVVGSLGVAPGTGKPANAQDFTVTYTPIMKYGTATSTRTILFVDAAGKAVHAPLVQTITYKTVTNEATGETVYTPQGAYYAAAVPAVAGYRPEASEIPQEAVGASTGLPADTKLTISYVKAASQPTTPEGTVDNGSQGTATGTGNTSVKPGSTETEGQLTGTKTSAKSSKTTTQAKLPATGDEASSALALAGAALLGLFGLSGLRRERQ